MGRAVAESSTAVRTVFSNGNLRRIMLAFGGSLIGDWAYATAISVWAFGVGGAKVLAAPLPKESTGLPRRSFDLAPRAPHFAPKAKAVIQLFMNGGPSQMDLFDPKPELRKWHGKPLQPSMTKDLKLAFIKPTAAVLASPREFQQHGGSGVVGDPAHRPGGADALSGPGVGGVVGVGFVAGSEGRRGSVDLMHR